MTNPIKFTTAVLAGIAISFVLAVGHVLFGTSLIGSVEVSILDSYVFFLCFAFLGILASLYGFYFGDISETIGILASGTWALVSGLEDIFVYLLIGEFRSVYPWLEGKPPGMLAYIFGTEVTHFMLLANVFVTAIPLVILLYFMLWYF